VKETWDSKDFFQLVELAKSLSTYIKAREIVSRSYNIPLESADSYLTQLIFNIVFGALEDKLDERGIEELISIFLNDLEEKPCEYSAEVWLGGLILKNEVLNVKEGLRLRRPTPSDLSFEYPLDLIIWTKPKEPIMEPTAILEATQVAQPDLEVRDYVDRLLLALKLYKPCSIVKVKVVFTPRSILRHSYTEFPLVLQSVIYRCKLGLDELENLKMFLSRIEPLLPVTRGRI